MDILYMVTMGAIRVWRKFFYIFAYVAFKPIKTHIKNELNKAEIGTEGVEPDDMAIRNDFIYHRISCDGTLGLAESYMDGWWDCERLDEFFFKIYQTDMYQKSMYPWDRLIHYLSFEVFNLQTVTRSSEVADKHYDLGMR